MSEEKCDGICDLLRKLGEQRGWDVDTAHEKALYTKHVLALPSLRDGVEYLLEGKPVPPPPSPEEV